MNVPNMLRHPLLLCVLLALAATNVAAQQERPPNVVVIFCDVLPTALKYVDPSTDLDALTSDGTDLMPYLSGQKPPLTGRLYINFRTLNHRSNTWDGGRDTEGKTTGTCKALIADDCKVMRLSQNAKDQSRYSYAFHHLPNMAGKDRPRESLKEDYYADTATNPAKKAAMIKQLEELLEGTNLQ